MQRRKFGGFSQIIVIIRIAQNESSRLSVFIVYDRSFYSQSYSHCTEDEFDVN